MEGYERATYGEAFAAVYDEWYGDLGDPEACCRAISDLARRNRQGAADGARVLELGAGTGRLALPLARAGLSVVALDVSLPMLRQLVGKSIASEPRAIALAADMVDLPFGGEAFDVVFVGFNGIFNVTDPVGQRQAIEEAARVLAPGGSLVVETIVVAEPDDTVQSLDVAAIGIDELVLVASRLDPDSKTITGQHVQIREDGIHLRPWHLRYLTIDELDGAAQHAGLRLERRWRDWSREPFHLDSPQHVSVYGKPA